jgi:hypothetical protein
MQYGGEGDWTEADVAAHNATRPLMEQIAELRREVAELRDLVMRHLEPQPHSEHH